jgi:glutathione S-transferase
LQDPLITLTPPTAREQSIRNKAMTKQDAPTVPSSIKLYYFNIKGKGEPIRLLCSYGGLKLQDYRFSSYDEFIKMKDDGTFPFGQVPMLEVVYGPNGGEQPHTIVQSSAIMRYLGRITGLYPASCSEHDLVTASKIDAMLDQENDAFTGITVLTYSTRFGIDLTDDMKDSSYGLVNTQTLPGHLSKIEKQLSTSSTGWLAGTAEPSICDFVWACRLQSLATDDKLSTKIQSLEEFPNLKAFVGKFFNLEPIKEYYKNEAGDS